MNETRLSLQIGHYCLVVLLLISSSLCGVKFLRSRLSCVERWINALPGRSVNLDRRALPEPPDVPAPDADESARLRETSHRVRLATLYFAKDNQIGGTGFVISKKHRLLVTNAHVAECFERGEPMCVGLDGHLVQYSIREIWMHPSYKPAESLGVFIEHPTELVRYFGSLSADVAIVQLTSEGPDLPEECPVRREPTQRSLIGQPAANLGFSSHSRDRAVRTRSILWEGRISQLTRFRAAESQSPTWTMIDLNARGAHGDSGGPLFLADGSVVGIVGWSRPRQIGKWETPHETTMALGLEALWDVIDFHGLNGMIEEMSLAAP